MMDDRQHRKMDEMAACSSPEERARASSAPGLIRRSFNHVPRRFTRLIGRDQEVQAVCALLQRPEVRLLTLTGTAGIGKTRLAQAVMATLEDAFPAGCHFVSLESLDAAELLLPTLIQELGLPFNGSPAHLESLVAFLRDKQALLILDNFEQLALAAPTLVQLLERCSGVKVLLTSRAVLQVQGEHIFQLSPLALPDLTALPAPEALRQYGAIALFVERAQAVRHGFQLTAANTRVIAEICLCLDGLPLALELAAARIRLLSPHALLARLAHRLEILTGGGPDLPVRQQTLRSTLDWSYTLLTAEEQWLFRYLAVFAGGCTLKAIEALCSTLGGLTTPVLDVVASLLDKSLLQLSEPNPDEPHFFLFGAVREYALECLATGGELERARDAHAAYYRAAASEAEPAFFGVPHGQWLVRLQRELPNVQAALEWLLARNQTEGALQVAGALGEVWFLHGQLPEGRRLLEQALALARAARPPTSPQTRSVALYMAGWIAGWQRDYTPACTLLTESLQAFRELADGRGSAASLNLLGLIEHERGGFALADARLEEGLQLCRRHGEQRGTAALLLAQGIVALFRGEPTLAEKRCGESLALFTELGGPWSIAANLHYLGWAAYCQGDIARARQLTEASVRLLSALGNPRLTAEALTILAYEVATLGEEQAAQRLFEEGATLGRVLDNPITVALAWCGLGQLAWQQHDLVQARLRYEEGVKLLLAESWRSPRVRWALASCFEGLAAWGVAQAGAPRAVRLLGAADALRFRQGYCLPRLPFEQPRYASTLASVRSQLGAPSFAVLWVEGQALAPEHVLAAARPALSTALAHQREPGLPPTPPGGLTAREVEVLALIATGLTNRQIAEQLVISPHTVDVHVQTIYRKLELTSRTAATRFALKHGLVSV